MSAGGRDSGPLRAFSRPGRHGHAAVRGDGREPHRVPRDPTTRGLRRRRVLGPYGAGLDGQGSVEDPDVNTDPRAVSARSASTTSAPTSSSRRRGSSSSSPGRR
jgi:hypothetical protein